MAVLYKKARMVCFRISESEFESLSRMSVDEGARTLSSFVRDVIRQRVAERARKPESEFALQIERLDAVVRRLESEVDRLAEAIEIAR